MRIAILADIHGNLLALEAVIDDLQRRSVDLVVNLGDCVSGPLWPSETAQKLMDLAWPTVRGNHDRWVTDVPPDKLYPSDAFARRSLTTDQFSWLRGLPPALQHVNGVYACHGSPADDNAYMLEDVVGGHLALASGADIAARIGTSKAPIVLCAHSHIPRVVYLDGTIVLNPGSVGQPAYEDPTPPAHVSETGSPLARYAVLTEDPTGPHVELIALPYDHERAAKRAEEVGNPAWAYFLRTGFARGRAVAG